MEILFQYQVSATPIVIPANPASNEASWHFSWSEPVRQKIDPKLAIALAAGSGPSFTPVQVGESIFADKWLRWLSEPVRTKQGLAAHQQQFLALDPNSGQETSSILYSMWGFQWSDPIRLPIGLKAHLQRNFTISPTALTAKESVTEDRWHQPWSIPNDLRKRGLSAHLQQTFTIDTFPLISEANLESKWHQGWSIPPKLSKTWLSPEAQQSVAFSPIFSRPYTQGYFIC